MQGPPGDPRYGQQRPPVAPYGTYNPQSYGGPQPQAPQPFAGGFPGQVPGHFGGAALPGNVAQPKGLPSALAFVLGLVAVVVALVFDVIFLNVHIPGAGSYAWYLTTALAFGGAGYGGAKWTRAGRTVAITSAVIAAILYGAADVGLGLVLEGVPMGTAIVLAAQGFAIALFTGCGGVYRGLRARDDDDD